MRKWLLLVLGIVTLASAYSLYEPIRIETRVDYELGVVFLERWRGTYYLGVERVIPLDEFLDYRLRESVVDQWNREVKASRQQSQLAFDSKGLIPDIDLPALPVFGEGSKIDISGQDRITLGGRQTVVEGGTRTLVGQSWFPELKMEQQLSVRLNGTIGERTKVNIDHDSERREGQNKIKLSYEGIDDDIVQSVELGDTRLSIPGTGYTGDLPAHKGLFGVSATGKLAGVDLYAIASREESQGQSQSFQGRRQVSIDTSYGRDYMLRRFYYIDVSGQIENMRVYVDDKNPSNNEVSFQGIATVYPDYPDSVPAAWSYDRSPGDFDLKSMGSDFVLHPGNILEFATAVGQGDIVGVVVFTDEDTVGGQTHHDSLVLKLLKPELTDSLSLTWDYQMRNVYALPRNEVQLSSARLYRYNPEGEDSEYETEGPNAGRKFVEILGLDPNGDGKLEYPQFDSKTGLVRFPDLKPFASLDLSIRDSVLYRKYPLELNEGRRFYLVVEYSSKTETYYLGQPDIEEGSERVHVDGVLWTKGVNYDINYATGVLSFITPPLPDADIRVTFEYRPWFSMSQKSLLGARAEWNIGSQGKVGSSVFYRSEGMPDDKPVLGSEPFRRMIAEADASYNVSSDGVSAFMDRLPLLRAQAPSSFRASVEGAVSLPDPNTRGVAYLDDFEGTTITRDVTTNAILWYHASVPVDKDSAGFASAPLYWSTPLDKVRKDSVFGPSIGDEGRETQDFLRVGFIPDAGESESWAGMMTSPSQLGMNLKDIENLQIILKSRRGSGTIHLSLGMSIDEDAPRRNRAGEIVGLNGRLDTEDRNGNGILDEGIEDTGMDTVFGVDDDWLEGSPDDGNDDYDVTDNPAGTEGNRRLDSEDLDRSGFSRYNHYFECEIPLGEERYVTDLYNGWQLYRISLDDSSAFTTVGAPKWEDIRLVRIWFDGFEAADTIDFFSIEFVGGKWRNPAISMIADTNMIPVDTTEKVWVTQISKKTDTSYVPPFEPKTDIYGGVEQEASLLFGYQNLHANRRAVVGKASAERDDYRDYRDLRMYVHDDGNELDFLLRLGADSVNYYEYRARITDGDLVPGRDGNWYEFTIALDSFPGLKPDRDAGPFPESSWTSGRLRVIGNPSLADIRYTALGIDNHGNRPVTGGIWFDDMRLAGPNKETGYGVQARASVALSDFVNLGVSFTYSDPNFRRFSEGRGVKTGGFGTNVGTNITAHIDRLLPHSWGFSIPLTYALSRQQQLPKFSARYPDLRLNREQAAGEMATGQSEDISLNNLSKRQSGSKFLNYTVEAMGLSMRQRRAVSRAMLSRDSSRNRSLQWSYGISPNLKFGLGEDFDIHFLPQSVRLGLGGGDQLGMRSTRISPTDTWRTDTTVSRGVNTSFGVEYSPIEDLSFDYATGSERDLIVPDPDSLWVLEVGSEAGCEHNFSASFAPDLVDFISPSIDFDGDYSDERPKLDSVYQDYRNMNNMGDIDFGLGLDLPDLLGRLEREEKDEDDTTGGGPSAVEVLQGGAEFLSRTLDPIDFDYSISRTSDLIKVYAPVPWSYRLGFTDEFDSDTFNSPTSAMHELDNSLRVSSGVQVKELRVRFGYDWSQGRNANVYNINVDRNVNWPDLDISLGKVHNLFPQLATDSRLSSKYRRRAGMSGELITDSLGHQVISTYGKNETRAIELNPLVSWQATWKNRISTTLSANYSSTAATSYLSETGDSRSITDSDSRGGELSFSYAFSAPHGLKLPFLKRVRFSSDLRLSWSLQYSQSNRSRTLWAKGIPEEPVPQQHDNSWSTRLASSYSFSRTVEAGLNTSYNYTKGLTGISSKTTNLDIWVLFKF